MILLNEHWALKKGNFERAETTDIMELKRFNVMSRDVQRTFSACTTEPDTIGIVVSLDPQLNTVSQDGTSSRRHEL